MMNSCELNGCPIGQALAKIVKACPTSAALFNKDMRYLSASCTWGKDLELVFDANMLGKSYYEIFPEQPKHWKRRFDKSLTGEMFAGEAESVAGVNGIYTWLAMHIVPWIDMDGSVGGILVYTNAMVDVMAEKRESDANLKKMIENLKRSNLELERFAHSCSHDLKEPLRSISGFVQLLLTHNSGSFDDMSINYIQHILKGLDRMGGLIKDILLYSRISTEKSDHCAVDVNNVLNDVINVLFFRLQEAGAVIHIEKMPCVMGDVTQIGQLFANLIENALKFRSSTPLVIDVAAKNLGDSWEINVKDNGIGIEKEYQITVFDMFKRLNSKNKYEGSGVGLAICKKIVNAHGGNIFVQSNIGGGCDFVFTLPKI